MNKLKKDQPIIINLIKVNNCLGLNFYTGAVRLGDLFKHMNVPIYEPQSSDITASGSGYQREPKRARINMVINRITNRHPGVEIPNKEPFVDNININISSSKAENFVSPLKDGNNDYGDIYSFKYIENFGKMRIVDGQTRLTGAKRAYNEARESKDYNLADNIADTRIQITLTFCDDIYKEAYVFYLINQYSKAIPPDGATRLLFEGMKKNDINFVNEVTRSGKAGEIESMGVAEKLNHESNIWAGNIKDFNESGGSKMSIRAVAKIIMPLYTLVEKNKTNSDKKTEDITLEIVEAFWLGFKEAYPMIFDNNSASNYNALKAGPSEIMMKVLTKIYSLSFTGQIKDCTKSSTYKNILKPVLANVMDFTPLGQQVRGEKLFLVGKKGAMGKYSNNAAKKDAAEMINKELFKHLNIPLV